MKKYIFIILLVVLIMVVLVGCLLGKDNFKNKELLVVK